MITITEVLSDETTDRYIAPDGKAYPSNRGLCIYATDDEDRPWRIVVFFSDQFGFRGASFERTDVPEYRESDLDEEEASWYPPFVPVDPDEALARIEPEFRRASEAAWTQVYTAHWEGIRQSYERLSAVLAGECRIAEAVD